MSVDQPDSVVESLRQERLNVQKKTFTKWANVQLLKYSLAIDDLFVDMGDGLKLMKLLESLTGEKLGKPAKGTARINKIENVSRCLAFLHSKKIRLENISSEDIVDGKPHLILGLLWTIILRLDIEINAREPIIRDSGFTPNDIPPSSASNSQRIPKELLLLWCQKKTERYPKVKVRDFHRSWRNGLAFNAIIHSHAEKLVDFDALQEHEHRHNLSTAFNIAAEHFGVPKLLDPEDVDTNNPDEKSIIIYVSTLSKGCRNFIDSITSGKRIANILTQLMEVDSMKEEYNDQASDLLDWIYSKIEHFDNYTDSLQSLEDIQAEIQNFKEYRTKEKPLRNEQRNDIETLLFSIQMKRLDPTIWTPDDIGPAEIEKAWNQLEHAEHEHEVFVREHLKEQERLENLAYKLESKRSVRENYLKEMQKILTNPNYGTNIKQADATFKQHEVIRTGITSREILMTDLFKIAQILIDANYRRKDEIIQWNNELKDNWNYVLRLLEAFDEKFAYLRQVIKILEELDSLVEEIKEVQVAFQLENEPLDIQASLQDQAVKEVQVASYGETVRRMEAKVDSQSTNKDSNVLQIQLTKLQKGYQNLVDVSTSRRKTLEDILKRKQHSENVDEMKTWIQEMKIKCESDISCKDLSGAISMQKKHKVLGSDIQLRKGLSKDYKDEGLETEFAELEKCWLLKETEIAFNIEAYQYAADAAASESWITEQLHLLSSLDYGSDELTCEALIRRHNDLQREISVYSEEIYRLRQQADKICTESFQNNKDSKSSKELKSSLSRSENKISLSENSHNSTVATDIIQQKQSNIEVLFSELKEKSEERNRRLQQNVSFFYFQSECENMEKWMREKEHFIDNCDLNQEDETSEKNFEVFITDFVARGVTMKQLKNLAESFSEERSDHSQTANILFDDVNRRWNHLKDLTSFKEKSLKGFNTLLVSHRICDETTTWLQGKCRLLSLKSPEKISNIDMLRRKEETVRRELIPAEERVKQAHIMAENLINTYPENSDSVQTKIRVLNEHWQKYQEEVTNYIKKLRDSTGVQICQSSVNSLLEWHMLMARKLNMREKIQGVGVAESVIQEHEDLGQEITVQDERFQEVAELGESIIEQHQEVAPLLQQLQEAREKTFELWREKQDWLQQTHDLQAFNREADHMHSLCVSQDTLLDSAKLGNTLSDLEMHIRHHNSFTDTLRAQESRFKSFQQMAEALIASEHMESEYIRTRCEQILGHRADIIAKTQVRQQLLIDGYEFQEFKADTQELTEWILQKTKMATELASNDSTLNLNYKMKLQKTFEAEVASNKKRLRKICERGEALMKSDSHISSESVEAIVEDLNQLWDTLWNIMQANQVSLKQAFELKNYIQSVDIIVTKINDIAQSLESPNLGTDMRSIKGLMKNLEVMEVEKSILSDKVYDIIQKGEEFIDSSNENTRASIKRAMTVMQEQFEALEIPLKDRKKKLGTCLKFHQFKSDVDKELLWMNEQYPMLTSSVICKNLLDAQKLQKKLESLEVAAESHEITIKNLQAKVLTLVTEEECPVDVTQPCKKMMDEWENLSLKLSKRKEEILQALKVQSFYSEATEIDSWIVEKKEILNDTNYGKDEDFTVKLITKHKALELEIDSYHGLVEELSNQGNMLIECNHPESKIVKNRMEMIHQEMKNIKKMCSVKRQKLLETKSCYEFEKETEELKAWISEQMSEATSEDFGEDYERVLILSQNFEFFRTKIDAGTTRILQYEDSAKRLLRDQCYFSSDVERSLEEISSLWSDLVAGIEARSFKMEAAAEIHRYHRDVTDLLSRIHIYYRSIPQDLGHNLNRAEDLIKKHDNIENELLGLEAQVHMLLEDSQRLQEAYPGGNEEHIQMQLALVVENWNLLQQKVSNRKTQLLAAQRIHKFLSSAREEESRSKEICLELQSDIYARDIQQMENDFKLLERDIECHPLEPLIEEGKSLLSYKILESQIEEKLKSLTNLQKKLSETKERRYMLIQRKKEVFSFFQEAKQIQAAFAKREIQLCGSENKETVEDIDIALKKHLEFQKSMNVQEEKFVSWRNQGEDLLKQRTEDSEKISKKLQDLSERRKRLLEFSAERSKSLAEALKHAKFKRDTVEAESWIQDKKSKLRLVLKGYNQLSDEEKIKCLQKQQAIHAELEVQEPFINSIKTACKELRSGPETETRLKLMLEDWEEIKENAARIGRDLHQAREMLLMHDLLEKMEGWIKEKELMVQANETGKDYEHCLALQAKLDDVHSDNKVGSENFLQEMRKLATKLSTNEDQKGVYVRYERNYERWNWLKGEIQLYRKKLKDAAQVHGFVRDVDDTIERILEKKLILSAREEVSSLSSVQTMQRKLDMIEQDVSVLDSKLKEQEREAAVLAEKHQLSAGRISDKMNHALRERSALSEELKAKKQYMDALYKSLKYTKDVNDLMTVIHEIMADMEFGEVSSNTADTQSLLTGHHEINEEIQALQKKIEKREIEGKLLLRSPGILTKEVDNSIRTLQTVSVDLDTVWQNRLQTLERNRDLQIFLEKVKQVENWLSTKEAFLANQDMGDSLSTVEALLRKHENFEETCQAHFDKIAEVEKLAQDLQDNDEFELIQSKCDEICLRRSALQDSCLRRKRLLQDAKTWQQLLLERLEITTWIREKTGIVSDTTDLDLSNLLSKQQKLSVFEAEILAHHPRVLDFKQQAEQLIEQEHFAALEIQHHVEDVVQLWENAMEATNNRKERLKEAHQIMQLKRKLDDINSWLEETEARIQAQDDENNVSDLQTKISQIQDLQKEAGEYSQNLRLLSNLSEDFCRSNQLTKEEMASDIISTTQRFHNMEEMLRDEETQLQELLHLRNIENDISDELSWIESNIKLCETEQSYDNVMTVQALQKKMQALETEITSREPLISSTADRARRSNDDVLTSRVQHMEDRFLWLKDALGLKRQRLADALEAQTYYFEATQAEMWMKEKLGHVVGFEAENIYSVQTIEKKLGTLEAATYSFRDNIQSLEKISSNLIERHHFDSGSIKKKQDEVNDLYEELRQNILKKTAIIREKEDFFIFEKDTKSILSQLKALSNVVSNSEHGKDVEHVEALIQKLQSFGNRLQHLETDIEILQQRGHTLIEEGHSETEGIDELLKDLQDMWQKCNDLSTDRLKILERERAIHSFYKSADETVSWIHEKDVAFSSEDYGKDLESIKSLIRHHNTLEGDTKAIQEQVEALSEEAVDLSSQFPEFQDDIQSKQLTVTEAWNQCMEKSSSRKDKLLQAEKLQSYFDEARDFHSWIYEMSALIESNKLPEDITSCEDLIVQHEGYKSEIDARFRSFTIFETRGKEITSKGHFLSQDVEAKVDAVSDSMKELMAAWEKRRGLYEQILDLLIFRKKITELETWLNTQEHNLVQGTGRSVEEVDFLIQKNEQFEKKLELYEPKFQELQENTKLEDYIAKEKQNEMENKRIEEQRLAEEKRNEDEKMKKEKEEKRMSRTPTGHSQISSPDNDYISPGAGQSELGRTASRIYRNRKPFQERTDTPPPVIPGTSPTNFVTPQVPSTRAEGFLSRKQEFETGGTRSHSRQWKSLYTVLCGQLLCFFKDKKNFLKWISAKPPVNVYKSHCYVPKDYHKRKNVFRLELDDNSVFLFEAANDIKRDEWMQKLNYVASLTPSKQYMTAAAENTTSLASPQKYSNEITEEPYSDIPDQIFGATPSGSDLYSTINKNYEKNSSELYDDVFPEKRSSVYSNLSNSVYEDSNLYDDDPFDDNRAYSITSYETEPKSARSSLSNQSSYRTAIAESSSISTLQDETLEDDHYDHQYGFPRLSVDSQTSIPNRERRASSEALSEVDGNDGKKLEKRQSATLPGGPPLFETVVKKKKRKFFSLRR